MIPKFHWLLQYHQQVLFNCFCLERKHRVPKRYANDLTNTSRNASQSLLMECTCHHLSQLKKPGTFNFAVGLVNPRLAPKRLQKLVSEALHTGNVEVKYSVESRFNKLGTCRKSDLVHFRDLNGLIKVARILAHFDIVGVPVTMIAPFRFVRHRSDSSSWWEPQSDGAEWIATECIEDTLVHSVMPGGSVLVINPL